MSERGHFCLALFVTALLVSACGGDDATPESSGDSSSPTTTTAAGADVPAGDGADIGESGDYDAGTAEFRIVNLWTEDIDVYATTADGQVFFYPELEGFGPDEVSDYLTPPDPGKVAGYLAGSTDLFPFGMVDGWLFDIRGETEPDDREGLVQTIVLAPDEAGEVDVRSLWEQPLPEAVEGSFNAIPPAVAGQGLVVFAHVGADPVPTLKIADLGATACRTPDDLSPDQAMGDGTKFTYTVAPGTTSFQFHDWSNADYDCTDPAIATLDVDVAADERVLVLVHGDESGDVTFTQLPLS